MYLHHQVALLDEVIQRVCNDKDVEDQVHGGEVEHVDVVGQVDALPLNEYPQKPKASGHTC